MTAANESMAIVTTACKYVPLSVLSVTLIATWICLSACGERATYINQRPKVATQKLPSATEVFNLRSECAKLGDKLLSENTVGRALSQSQISHYNPRTNRCHVELTVQTADQTRPLDVMSKYLFDGQTGEMLAYAKVEKGTQSGMAFNKVGMGFDEAVKYIDQTMNDE